MVYVIQVCRQLSSRTSIEHPGPARKLSTNLYDIYHCWVYSEWTPDDGQRNCPKHVEFHAKINASSWFYYKQKMKHYLAAMDTWHRFFFYTKVQALVLRGVSGGGDVQMSIVTTRKRGVYHVPYILRSQNKILTSDCVLPCFSF